MSFLKLNSLARKSAVALLAVAGVLLFEGGAWADVVPVPGQKVIATAELGSGDTVQIASVGGTAKKWTVSYEKTVSSTGGASSWKYVGTPLLVYHNAITAGEEFVSEIFYKLPVGVRIGLQSKKQWHWDSTGSAGEYFTVFESPEAPEEGNRGSTSFFWDDLSGKYLQFGGNNELSRHTPNGAITYFTGTGIYEENHKSSPGSESFFEWVWKVEFDEAKATGDYEGVIAWRAKSGGDTVVFANIKLVVSNPSNPTVSSVTVNRTSNTAGAVTYTSSAAGTGYYAVVASGASAPGIPAASALPSTTWKTLGAATASENANKAIALTSGAKKVYVIVKDGSNRVSTTAAGVEVPAYTPTPGAPTLTAAVAGDAEVTLRWTAPSNAGTAGVTKYQYKGHNGATWEDAPTGDAATQAAVRSVTVGGLTNGTTYEFVVRAVGPSGNGTESNSLSATPFDAPDVSGSTQVATITSVAAQTKSVFENEKKDTVSFTVTVTVVSGQTLETTKIYTPTLLGAPEGVALTEDRDGAEKIQFSGSGATRTATIKVWIDPDYKEDLVGDNTFGVYFENTTGTKVVGTVESADIVPVKLTVKEKVERSVIVTLKTVTYTGSKQGIAVPTVSGLTSPKFTYTYTNKTSGDEISDTNAVAVINAGVYTVSAVLRHDTIQGVGTNDFTIEPKALTDNMITLTPTSIEYNGDARYVDVQVKDGNLALAFGSDKDFVSGVTDGDGVGIQTAFANNTNAGTATVRIKGNNNYVGQASKTFTITQRTISLNAGESVVPTKEYDGTDTVDAAEVKLAFNGLIEADVDAIDATSYKLTDLKYNSANVALNVKVTAKVALATTGAAKNYKFSSATVNFESQVSDYIKARAPTADDFAIDDTSRQHSHYYTGTARGIGKVGFNSKYKAQPANSKLTVVYEYNGDSVSSVIPIRAGDYKVLARVENNANFGSDPGDVEIGEYVIAPQQKPDIDIDLPDGVTVRRGKSVQLAVTATSPNGTASALKYQWYRVVNDTGRIISGATNASYTYNTVSGRDSAAVGTLSYFYVKIVNNPGATIQVPDSIQSNTVVVTVDEPAKSIETAKVVIGEGDYVYSGVELTPSSVTVTLGTEPLSEGTDYTYTVSNNKNAGTALVRVVGLDKYEGVANGTFAIAKKPLELEDLTFKPNNIYNGAAQPAVVTATDGRTGLGAVTVTYATTATPPVTLAGPPTEAGVYTIKASVGAGTNFTASDSAFALGEYEIIQKVVVAADLEYTAWPSQILVDSAKTTGIGAVTLKVPGYTGKLAVLYNGSVDVPMDTGSYKVLVEIPEDKNFIYSLVEIGTYNIVAEPVSVAQSGREVPNKVVVEEASVAPIKAFSATFTAGPSPVAKASGEIKFFSTKSVKGGSLYVFDANGNAVAKVPAKQGSGKEVGSWNLKNNKGATVSEGTYVVKGALVGKDGTKEKVSFVFSVK